jgi:DNA-binding GntR family transcriptional regulator
MAHERRDEARTEIERRIVTGELPGGLILDESALAAELAIDAESVREGLICLLADGLVRAVPGDRFSVSPVDELELREAYPVALLLEGLAIRTGPPYPVERIGRLREINAAMRAESGDPLAAANHDHAFHAELAVHCGNEQLLETLRPLKRLLLRYEYAYMRAGIDVEHSLSQHDAICDHLERGDHEGAAATVEANFRDALPYVVDRL